MVAARIEKTIAVVVKAKQLAMNSLLRSSADKAPQFGMTSCPCTRSPFPPPRGTYQFGGAPTGYCSRSNTEPLTHWLSSLAK